MKQEQITLRCEDGAEAVVFTKYTHHILDIDYEICIEDSYIGGNYKGFFGRIKRAWRAFWNKPVVYTGIYCEDERKMRQFLYDCLDLVNDNPDSEPTSNKELIKSDNKTCKHCQPPYDHFGKYYIVGDYPNDPGLHVLRRDDAMGGVMIDYCPMCGRKL